MFIMDFLTSSSIPCIICSVLLTYFQIICTNSLILESSATGAVVGLGSLDSIPEAGCPAVVVEFAREVTTAGASDPVVWEKRIPIVPFIDRRVLDARSIEMVAITPDLVDSRCNVSDNTLGDEDDYASQMMFAEFTDKICLPFLEPFPWGTSTRIVS